MREKKSVKEREPRKRNEGEYDRVSVLKRDT